MNSICRSCILNTNMSDSIIVDMICTIFQPIFSTLEYCMEDVNQNF